MKLPKTIAAAADQLYKLRADRAALNKQVDNIKEQETALQTFIIDNLDKSSTGVAGKLARVQVVTKIKPTVNDWDAFYAHIKKKGEWELMQRRVSEAAVAERWEQGKAVPGVGEFKVVTLSLTKI